MGMAVATSQERIDVVYGRPSLTCTLRGHRWETAMRPWGTIDEQMGRICQWCGRQEWIVRERR